MPNDTSGWDGILEPGESILWQGRPDTAVVWMDLLSAHSLFGVFFAGFSLLWMGLASSIGTGLDLFGLVFALFGLPFLLIGIYLSGGRLMVDAWRRRQTWYTLSDRAAYVATDLLGRRGLKRYPVSEMTRLDLDDSAPGAVWFSEVHTRHSSRNRGRNGLSSRRLNQVHVEPVGFERIAEARAVYAMIRDLRAAHQP